VKGIVISLAAIAMGAALSAAPADEYLVYSGTYTNPQNPGIQGFRWHPADGSLVPIGLMGEVANPSWVTVHPNGKYLYAAGEQTGGRVTAFAINHETGKLTLLNSVSSGGAGPCHLSFDRSGKFIFAANYDGGSIAVFPVAEDGHVGEASDFVQHRGQNTIAGADKQRQEAPHAHVSVVSSDNRFVFVADLGLDEVLVYRFDAGSGKLTPNDPPFWRGHPGAGPRHLAFAPDGKRLYLVNELNSTVTVLSYDARSGRLKELQSLSTLPADFKGENTGAEIEVDPTGRFVYASNRGHDSIAVFAVHRNSLQLVQNASTLGKEPRHFTLDPSGKYLLAENQNSNSIVVFHVDPKTGMLHPSGAPLPVISPVCLAFTPSK